MNVFKKSFFFVNSDIKSPVKRFFDIDNQTER
jgi:hypothetical protein